MYEDKVGAPAFADAVMDHLDRAELRAALKSLFPAERDHHARALAGLELVRSAFPEVEEQDRLMRAQSARQQVLGVLRAASHGPKLPQSSHETLIGLAPTVTRASRWFGGDPEEIEGAALLDLCVKEVRQDLLTSACEPRALAKRLTRNVAIELHRRAKRDARRIEKAQNEAYVQEEAARRKTTPDAPGARTFLLELGADLVDELDAGAALEVIAAMDEANADPLAELRADLQLDVAAAKRIIGQRFSNRAANGILRAVVGAFVVRRLCLTREDGHRFVTNRALLQVLRADELFLDVSLSVFKQNVSSRYSSQATEVLAELVPDLPASTREAPEDGDEVSPEPS